MNEPLNLPDLIPYRKGVKWGFCDKNGIIKIAIIYNDASIFSSGLAAVTLNAKNCYIEKSGKLSFETCYDTIGDFKDFMAIVSSCWP